ncbi:uncharacterized protein LOC120666824 isoform X3 [Panicum virgatum]|uniref:uncharacterized protein LOC120666824 isoform X3 n=1 Tax=Panicum virgatum TaxID=38727 RepID=UPI0019D538F0|nr:uncharacterized protein LOC120666824 isoform X3 [Panicum virgatum]XP_039802729.1 uncharacterized protein LOC120666824 isoform X3 [Panicum virgatum]
MMDWYPLLDGFCLTSTSKLKNVNIPKTKKTYCKNKVCRKHTLQKATQYKKGQDHQEDCAEAAVPELQRTTHSTRSSLGVVGRSSEERK